jgi:hypothetical protein
VVVLWIVAVLLVNSISDVDSLPMLEGRSDVVGVCAPAMDVNVDIPIIDEVNDSALANKTK